MNYRTKSGTLRFALVAFFLLLTTALTFSCSSADPIATPAVPTATPIIDLHPAVGEPFDLPLNTSAFLDENGYRVTMMRVVADNRCPDGANCPSAGAAAIELLIRQSATDAGRLYTLGSGAYEAASDSEVVGDFEIQFTGLAPVPAGDNPAATATLVAKRMENTPGTLNLNASVAPLSVSTGETVEVSTDAGGSGIPQYTLWIAGSPVLTLRYDGTVVSQTPVEGIEITHWSADSTGASWSLRTSLVGQMAVKVSVSGEVQTTPDGPFVFAYGEESFTVTAEAGATR